MTDHDLRDLLRDHVAEVTTTPDLSTHAWSAARGVRRRRAFGVVVGAAAAAALVVAGVAVVGDQASTTPEPGPAPSPSRTLDPSELDTTPDGHFRSAAVYWSPSLAEEAELPPMTEGRPELPEEIDLSADATAVEDDPIDRAVAAFGITDAADSARVLLLAPDGSYRTLDLSDVGPDPTISCCQRPPVRDWMLSPTGEYVVFPQMSSLLLYDLAERRWREVDTTGAVYDSTWVSDRELFVPLVNRKGGSVYDVVTGEQTGAQDPDLGSNDLGLDSDRRPSYQFGQARRDPYGVLQSWGSGAVLPVPEGTPDQPEFLVATVFPTVILTFTGSPGGDERWLQCCPAVGWADNHVAMYESRSSTTPRIIGWSVGSHRFEIVSTITGFTPGQESYTGSYARYWE